jgi:streptogramin lyase
MLRARVLFVAAVAMTVNPVSAGKDPFSYVVLNHDDRESLVRLAPDGRLISVIAAKAAGTGLANDVAGNYIVANGRGLLLVTRSGKVSLIAGAPLGSQWIKVVQSPEGSFIVADNQLHALWRISPDGRSVARFAYYPIERESEMDDVSLAMDNQDNYLLLERNHLGAHLFRISPAGAVTEVDLEHRLFYPLGLVPDGPGNYLTADDKGGSIVRLTSSGECERIAWLVPNRVNITGIARNPVTGELVVAVNREHALLRISMDGKTATTLVRGKTYLMAPLAIMVEPGR